MDLHPSDEEIQLADELVDEHYPKKRIPLICLPRGVILIPTKIQLLNYHHCPVLSKSANDSLDQILADDKLRNKRYRIISADPTKPIIEIPKGELNKERLKSLLTPGHKFETFVKLKGSTTPVPYSTIT